MSSPSPSTSLRFGWSRLTTAVAIFLAAMLFGTVAPALALNTAVWTQASPAAGAVVLVKPTAPVVVADDTAAITRATMTMNGYPATFVNVDFFVGHSYYDEDAESDIWMVDDWTKARLTGYFPANRILMGTNTIVTTVTSAAGVSTYTRTFTYGSVTTIAAVSPSADSVIPASPADITVSLSSGATSFTSVMSVDGVVVPTTYTAATKTFKYTPAAALPKGTRTVSFSAVDSSGGSVSKTWKFKISPPMSDAAECGACHAGYPAAHPVADCSKCHDHAYAAPGSHGGAIPTAAGCSGDGGLEQDDACHRLDHSNDPKWGVWGSGPFDCAECHSATYPAVPQHTDAKTATAHVSSSTGCGPCHATSLVTEHGKYPTGATIKYQCTLCHGADAAQQVKDAVSAGNTACAACHSLSSGHEALHTTTVDPACSGSGCHSGTSLTSIHINAGTALTCDSCHKSADPDVVGAISTGDKSCAACHDAAAPHGDDTATHAANVSPGTVTFFDGSSTHANYEGSGGVDVGADCSLCHGSTNLLNLHANDCSICHSGSAPPRNTFASWNKSCSQGSCHPSYHDNASPAHDAEYAGGTNCSCHDYGIPESGGPITASEGYCGPCHATGVDTTRAHDGVECFRVIRRAGRGDPDGDRRSYCQGHLLPTRRWGDADAEWRGRTRSPRPSQVPKPTRWSSGPSTGPATPRLPTRRRSSPCRRTARLR